MVKIGSFCLVHFVEQQLEGWTFERKHWPLHLTLVPWFTVDDEEAVMRTLERVASKRPSLRLGVGAIEMFGVNQDIPVNVINNQVPIKKLHETLIDTLAEADSAYHEQLFIGQRYVAHITRHDTDGRCSNEGEEILVNNFQLVRLIDDMTCRVEQQFLLKQG